MWWKRRKKEIARSCTCTHRKSLNLMIDMIHSSAIFFYWNESEAVRDTYTYLLLFVLLFNFFWIVLLMNHCKNIFRKHFTLPEASGCHSRLFRLAYSTQVSLGKRDCHTKVNSRASGGRQTGRRSDRQKGGDRH